MLGLGGSLILCPASKATAQPSTPEAQAAQVTVEFLPDGRCTVASTGEGFRSKVTYKPEGQVRRGESRCAFPPVQKGMTVSLTVLLPEGAAEPGESRPNLAWSQADGRWRGTATLVAWPDAIVVTPQDHPFLFWMSVGVAVVLLAMVLGRRRSAGRRTAPRAAQAAA